MSGNSAERMTLDQVRALADQWKEQREDAEREPNAAYYRDATPHQVIEMWSTGRGTDGKKPKPRQFACLVERWMEIFGSLPPDQGDGSEDDGTSKRPMLPTTQRYLLRKSSDC